jgi:hypothetical protein
MNTTPNPIRRLSRRLPLLAAASMLAPAILPGITGAAPAPVKVFILAGQSNMVGHGKVEMGRDPAAAGKKAKEVKGGIGSLRYLVKNDPGKYGGLVDKKNHWIVRDDVWIWSTTDKGEKGKLTVGFGAGGWIGPEFGFGHVIGDQLDEPVLIIKTSWGGKDLGVDFRPPSAGMPTYDLGGKRQESFEKDPKIVGHYYRLMIEHVREVLKDPGALFPELAGRKSEIVGFGWHQGWNDGGNKHFIAEYEANLAHLIRDLRKEFGVEKLPVVIANSGFGGKKLSGKRLRIAEAQMAVADPAKYPAFKGNVFTVDTRPFHRTPEQSPSNFGYHWNHNGETHYLMGEAMGQGMVKLLTR